MLLPNCFSAFLLFYSETPITVRLCVTQLFNDYFVFCTLSRVITANKYKYESYCYTIRYQEHNYYIFVCHKNLLSYLLVSVSMEPHTWSAIQKPIIVQTIAVTAPTTNESMHIFKSFLYLLFNLLPLPCLTATSPRKSSVTATVHQPNGPLFQRPIAVMLNIGP